MLPSFCNESVVIVRAPIVDMRGTQCPDWAHATEHAVRGCHVAPSSTSSQRGEAREPLASDAVLYAPEGADIDPRDRVRWRGGLYEVDGRPMPRTSPTGRVSHTVVPLKRWEG